MTRSTAELVYFDGCPHVGAARANLKAALVAAGRRPSWTEWSHDDPAAPGWVRRYGSPTVLVRGQDVTGEGPGDAPACRVDIPSVERIVAALQQDGEAP